MSMIRKINTTPKMKRTQKMMTTSKMKTTLKMKTFKISCLHNKLPGLGWNLTPTVWGVLKQRSVILNISSVDVKQFATHGHGWKGKLRGWVEWIKMWLIGMLLTFSSQVQFVIKRYYGWSATTFYMCGRQCIPSSRKLSLTSFLVSWLSSSRCIRRPL